MTKVKLTAALLALLIAAPTAKGQSTTDNGSNSIVFTEVAPDASAMADSAQFAGEIELGMVIEGILSDDYDADVYNVCNETSIPRLYRVGGQTLYTNVGGRPFATTIHVFKPNGEWRGGLGSSGDLRGKNHLTLNPGQCAKLGVSNTGGLEIRLDPTRIVMTHPHHNEDGRYWLTTFLDLPTVEVRYAESREVHDLREVSGKLVCPGLTVFPHDADANVLRTILEVDESCAGYSFRVISNTLADCAQLSPAGDVVEVQSHNVHWRDYPGNYLPEAPMQDATDYGAFCQAPLVPGNMIAVGPFVREGAVRDSSQSKYMIGIGPSVGKIRQDDMIILPIKSEIAWATDRPLRFGDDGWAELRWTSSRQIDAVEVHLPEYGVTQMVPLHRPGDYVRTWSTAAPAGEEFVVKFELPANKGGGATTNAAWPPARGSNVRYTLTPLGVDGHSVRGRMDHLATSGATSVASEDEGDLPQAFALAAVYPNPTSGLATIELSVETAQVVTIELFDALGRRVATLHQGLMMAPGQQTLRTDLDVANGVYLIRVSGDGYVDQQMVVVVR